MARVQLPNGWRPRDYQMGFWGAFEQGCKHAELIWHRRSGKDEVALHMTACKMFERQGTYWHMLPLQNQARRAIWNAVNPHTGIRRIDEAFPMALRSNTLDNEMLIRFVNGSTWQVLGSDNYDALVGSPPAGVVFSEWALANPSARAYLRPIFAENNGWQMYITTPRGKNHAYRTYQAGLEDSSCFAQRLSAEDTGAISAERLHAEKMAYIKEWGQDKGTALFEQEYLCSFEAALLGAIYGHELTELERSGRLCHVPHDANYPVFTAWDIGWSDNTSIWFFQVIDGQIRVIDYYTNNRVDMQVILEELAGREIVNDEWKIRKDTPVRYGKSKADCSHRQAYDYAVHWLPHDGRAKTLAANGRTIEEQLWNAYSIKKVRIVANVSVQDGINAARNMLAHTYFDSDKTDDGVELLKMYQREWDDEKKMFADKPRHDFTSHTADALRYMALAFVEAKAINKPEPTRFPQHRTFNEIMEANRRNRQKDD